MQQFMQIRSALSPKVGKKGSRSGGICLQADSLKQPSGEESQKRGQIETEKMVRSGKSGSKGVANQHPVNPPRLEDQLASLSKQAFSMSLAMNEISKQVLTVCPVHVAGFTHTSKG